MEMDPYVALNRIAFLPMRSLASTCGVCAFRTVAGCRSGVPRARCGRAETGTPQSSMLYLEDCDCRRARSCGRTGRSRRRRHRACAAVGGADWSEPVRRVVRVRSVRAPWTATRTLLSCCEPRASAQQSSGGAATVCAVAAPPLFTPPRGRGDRWWVECLSAPPRSPDRVPSVGTGQVLLHGVVTGLCVGELRPVGVHAGSGAGVVVLEEPGVPPGVVGGHVGPGLPGRVPGGQLGVTDHRLGLGCRRGWVQSCRRTSACRDPSPCQAERQWP